jgi:hypothetical protein
MLAVNREFTQLDRGQVVATGACRRQSPDDWRVDVETPVRVLTEKRHGGNSEP